VLTNTHRIAHFVAVGITALVGVGVGLGGGRLIDGVPDPAPAAGATKVGDVAAAQKSTVPKKDDASKPVLPEASDDPTAMPGADRERVEAALRGGAAAAERLGGTVEAAVLLPGWPAPAIVGDPRRRSRMWSMAKPVAAIFARLPPEGPTRVVRAAMQNAIQRSENCPQRRVVLEVQKLAGGIPEARQLLAAVIHKSGASVVTTNQAEPATESCREYLRKAGEGLTDPFGSTLLLGTWTWTVADAVRFAGALGNGTYGEPGAAVLYDMARPKRASREATAMEHTMDPAFGAGKVWERVAYKSGWGGTVQHDFVVGQYGTVGGAGTARVAFAVVFHPDEAHQPPIDDPGRTPADEAIQAVLKPVKQALAD
jgi:hypothetical protein